MGHIYNKKVLTIEEQKSLLVSSLRHIHEDGMMALSGEWDGGSDGWIAILDLIESTLEKVGLVFYEREQPPSPKEEMEGPGL